MLWSVRGWLFELPQGGPATVRQGRPALGHHDTVTDTWNQLPCHTYRPGRRLRIEVWGFYPFLVRPGPSAFANGLVGCVVRSLRHQRGELRPAALFQGGSNLTHRVGDEGGLGERARPRPANVEPIPVSARITGLCK